MRSRSTSVEHVRHVDVARRVEHDRAAAEQRAERGPLAARVHERPERERDELARTRVAGRRGTVPSRWFGFVEHCARDLLGLGDRRSAGVPAADARRRRCPPGARRRPWAARSCRPCRGCSGRRPSARRSRGPVIRTPARPRTRARSVPRSSTPCRRRPRRASAVRRADHAPPATALARGRRRRTSATRSASSTTVLELVGDVAVVHVDRDGAQLVAGEHRLEVLDRVAQVAADVVAGPDAEVGQRVREPVRALVELAVRAAAGRRRRAASRSGTVSATHSKRSARLNSTPTSALGAGATGRRRERRL